MARRKAVSVGDYLPRWVSYCETRGLAPATIRNWRTYIGRFAEWSEDCPLETLQLGDLDDFISDRYGHQSWSSKKAATLALRDFYEWAYTRGHAANVAAGLTFPRKPRRDRPTYYKPEQMAAVLGAFHDPSYRLIAVLLARHGQRISAVTGLRWRQVDFDQAAVHYESVKRTRALSLSLDADTARRLQAWRALCRWTDPDDFVFESKRGRQYHRYDDAFRAALREACREVGVPYRGSHEFRRTLATTLLRMGTPLHAVSYSVLGHSSIQTTVENYAGPLDDSVADGLRNLPF